MVIKIKKNLIVISAILFILIISSFSTVESSILQETCNKSKFTEKCFLSQYASKELIVKFKEDIEITPDFLDGYLNIGLKSINELNKKYEVKSAERLIKNENNHLFSNIYKFIFHNDINLQLIAQEYSKNSNIEYAEPNYLLDFCVEPNDPYYKDYQWALNQNNDCDIDAPEAWGISTGSSDVIIAVLDTGVDYNHPDLIDNIWVNEDEIPGNGIDDDNNGFIDDYYGFDFYNSVDENGDGDYNDHNDVFDYDPMDDYGHGTHCAGIIAAVGDNGIGISGVCWNSKIMSIKIGDSNGVYISNAVEGLLYAADNGARIASMSWSGAHSELLEDTINEISDNVLLLASAGNYNTDHKYYPAAYNDVIAVAATNCNDEKMSLSNYGNWVDVAAPGVYILSLRASGTDMYGDGTHIFDKDDKYYYSSGTSMACPYVAGVAGLIFSKNNDITPIRARNTIRFSVDKLNPDLNIGRGRINSYAAMKRGTGDVSALILSPEHGEEINGFIEIKGDAYGQGFKKYCLQYAKGVKSDSLTWVDILDSTNSIENNVLGCLDTDELSEGYYTIRLMVECTDGIYEDLIWVLVNVEKNTIIVDVDNTEGPWFGTEEYPFMSIQDGIDYAGEQDIVFVKSGIYQEDILINKKLSLIGEDKDNTIIDGGGETATVQIFQTNGVEIKKFTIKNGEWGIHIYESFDNVISENTITESTMGIIISTPSRNNYIYHNNFYNNDATAYSTSDNTWYSPSLKEGNYWDDYDGEDNNNDGIGDTSYNIPGGDDQDNYPWKNLDGKSKSKTFVFQFYKMLNKLLLDFFNSMKYIFKINA